MSEPGWRKAWEEQEDEDYIFTNGHEMIGRVYRQTSGLLKGKWRWFFGGTTGHTESRREAMLAVEMAYEKSRDGAEG